LFDPATNNCTTQVYTSGLASSQKNGISSPQVEYGTTSSYENTTSLDSTLVTNHSQTLSRLSTSTTYQDAVISTDSGGMSSSADNTFSLALGSTTTLDTNLVMSHSEPQPDFPPNTIYTTYDVSDRWFADGPQ
jgi:hypothetical protein